MHSDPHSGIGVKNDPFWGVYPSFWGSNPLGEGVPWKTLLLLKKTPPEGGVPWPLLEGSSLDFPITFEKVPPRTPFLGGTPHFWVKMTHFFGVLLKIMINFGKNPPKTVQKRFFTVNTLKNRFLSVIFTVNTLIFGKIDPFWGVPPLGGYIPPQKTVKNERFLKAPKVVIGQNRTSLRRTSWNLKVEHFCHEF